jgi:hypothetical protein
MELEDCAFLCLAGIVATDKPNAAFTDVGYVIFVAPNQIKPGQVHRHLLAVNVSNFKHHCEWLRDFAKPAYSPSLCSQPHREEPHMYVTTRSQLQTFPIGTTVECPEHQHSKSDIMRKLRRVPGPDTSNTEADAPEGRVNVVDTVGFVPESRP